MDCAKIMADGFIKSYEAMVIYWIDPDGMPDALL